MRQCCGATLAGSLSAASLWPLCPRTRSPLVLSTVQSPAAEIAAAQIPAAELEGCQPEQLQGAGRQMCCRCGCRGCRR